MTGRPQQLTECMHAGRNGFWGIFLLAAWPNALFDLCGICCGHFLTPFWVFFGATFCGKALVKVCTALCCTNAALHCTALLTACQLAMGCCTSLPG